MFFENDSEPEQKETAKFVGIFIVGMTVGIAGIIALVGWLLKG